MTIVSPATTRVDVNCRLGDTFTLVLPVLDSSTPPEPVTVDGWTVHAQIRHVAGDELLYEWHTTPTGAQGTATAAGTSVSLMFDGVATAVWSWRRDAQFDVCLTEPNGTPHVLAAGRLRVIPLVTQGA